jgi:hypothetical protein
MIGRLPIAGDTVTALIASSGVVPRGLLATAGALAAVLLTGRNRRASSAVVGILMRMGPF